MIKCLICCKDFKLITNTHLKSHNMTIEEYKIQFPFALIVSSETSQKYSKHANIRNLNRDYSGVGKKISATKKLKFNSGERVQWNKGIVMSDEQKQKISDTIKIGYKSGSRIHHNLGKKLNSIYCDNISNGLENSIFYKHRRIIVLLKKQLYLLKLEDKKLQQLNEKIKTIQEYFIKENLEFLSDIKYVIENRSVFDIKCKTCLTKFSRTYQLLSGHDLFKCRTCFPVNTTSVAQLEIYEYITSLGIKVINNDRNVLSGKEIDLYIPSKNIGIEYNGLYWHSDKININQKHLLWKQQFAFNKGILLYHIFEDEWINKQDIVKSRLKQILNSQSNKIDARKCALSLINAKESNLFLDENHIQGKDLAGVRFGLKFDNELLGIMTFKKTNFTKGGNGSEWELSRFAVKQNFVIRGGASRLLKAFERLYKPKCLITYADRRWSFGDVYTKLGFTFLHHSPPCYWYIPKNKIIRLHRSNFMKHKLVKNGHDINKTEFEIMNELGYSKIYDCGHLKFIKQYN